MINSRNIIFENSQPNNFVEATGKLISNFIFIFVAYYVFDKYFGKNTAWFIGVPVGIALYALFVSIYDYYNKPLSNPATKQVMRKDILSSNYILNFFNFIFAWLMITIIMFITQNTIYKNNQVVLLLSILVIGYIFFACMYPKDIYIKKEQFIDLPTLQYCNSIKDNNNDINNLDQEKVLDMCNYVVKNKFMAMLQQLIVYDPMISIKFV